MTKINFWTFTNFGPKIFPKLFCSVQNYWVVQNFWAFILDKKSFQNLWKLSKIVGTVQNCWKLRAWTYCFFLLIFWFWRNKTRFFNKVLVFYSLLFFYNDLMLRPIVFLVTSVVINRFTARRASPAVPPNMQSRFPSAVDSADEYDDEYEELPFPDLTTMSKQEQKKLMIGYMFFDIGIATLSQYPFNGYARWMTWTTRNTMGCATVTVICSLKLLQCTARIIWRSTISLMFSLKQCRLVSWLSSKLSMSLMISCTLPTLVHNYSLTRSKHLEY